VGKAGGAAAFNRYAAAQDCTGFPGRLGAWGARHGQTARVCVCWAHRLNFCCRQALLPAASDLVVGSLSLPALGKEMDAGHSVSRG
jgi:hypothetical protein